MRACAATTESTSHEVNHCRGEAPAIEAPGFGGCAATKLLMRARRSSFSSLEREMSFAFVKMCLVSCCMFKEFFEFLQPPMDPDGKRVLRFPRVFRDLLKRELLHIPHEYHVSLLLRKPFDERKCA